MKKLTNKWRSPMNEIGVFFAYILPSLNIGVGMVYEFLEQINTIPEGVVTKEQKAYILAATIVVGAFAKLLAKKKNA